MSSPGQEFVEVFLQEASEHLQFLREYAGVLLDPYPAQDDIERLYVAAHTLKGSSAMYGFPLFSEVSAKLSHIFQYAMNVGISADATAALVEFVSEAVAVLESDLWMISSSSSETADDIEAFKAKYPFAFQAPVETPKTDQYADECQREGLEENSGVEAGEPIQIDDRVETVEDEAPRGEQFPHADAVQLTEPAQSLEESGQVIEPVAPSQSEPCVRAELAADEARTSAIEVVAADVAISSRANEKLQTAATQEAYERPEQKSAESLFKHPPSQSIEAVEPEPAREIELPAETAVPEEILEFFVPEAEEHLQAVTECLLAIEANPNEQDIHRLFRAMHTIKGSAAQVGLPRIALVAHRAEDLIGRLRDGALHPSAEIVDLCLEAVDTLKKFLYRQWPNEVTAQGTTRSLLARIAKLVPDEEEEELDSGTASGSANVSPDAGDHGVEHAGPQEQITDEPFTIADWIQTSPEPVVAADANPLDGVFAPEAASETGAPLEVINEAAALRHDKTPVSTSRAAAFISGETVEAGGDKAQIQQSSAACVEAPSIAADEPAKTRPTVEPNIIRTAAPTEREGVVANAAQDTTVGAAQTIATTDALIHESAAAVGKLNLVNAATAKKPSEGETGVQPDSDAEIDPLLGLKKGSAAVPLSRSVRIGLERLDRMMNAVGELVINRTRMLGRVAELESLADVLNFSKARMSDKINEFQEKYEFSRITGLNPIDSHHGNGGYRDTGGPSTGFGPGGGGFGAGEAFPFRGGYSSYSQKFDASLAEFSELEMDRYDEFSILSRSLTEISADITEILTQLDGFVRRVDSDIDEFTKLAHRLQDEITAARMVPIGNLYTRISRTVRDAAKAAGKQVELQLSGAETELDNNIIQQIADPLLHLVRNAVAHGIERADERYEQGKPDNGKLYVRAYHRGNHIYVEVEDDGCGLDYEKVRATAVELGLTSAEKAQRLSERDLQDMLFRPGFSTAARKTELAGRGVGLDVVRANLGALNGEVEIETQKGFGTRFTLKVPLTLIISQALFVRCGTSLFAFPLAFVEEIRRIREEQIEEVGGKMLTKVRDVVTEVVRLDRQLGMVPIEPLNGYYRLVIVNVAGRQVGIVVEEVLRKDEIVIKNLGEYLRNVKLFPGATIAPDGSLILLVDVNRLIAGEAIERRPLMTAANAARLFFPGASALASGEVPDAAIDAVPEEKVVVLADDSISVRKFVGRMLEKAGFRVRLASDGLEALEIVSQTNCDLVVTDLEMPRTNGYELIAHLKQNPETSNIPVMVVTSRAGAKHRDKAVKQGATEFMVKPVQEDQFVATVERLIGKASEPLRQSDGRALAPSGVQGQA